MWVVWYCLANFAHGDIDKMSIPLLFCFLWHFFRWVFRFYPCCHSNCWVPQVISHKAYHLPQHKPQNLLVWKYGNHGKNVMLSHHFPSCSIIIRCSLGGYGAPNVSHCGLRFFRWFMWAARVKVPWRHRVIVGAQTMVTTRLWVANTWGFPWMGDPKMVDL